MCCCQESSSCPKISAVSYSRKINSSLYPRSSQSARADLLGPQSLTQPAAAPAAADIDSPSLWVSPAFPRWGPQNMSNSENPPCGNPGTPSKAVKRYSSSQTDKTMTILVPGVAREPVSQQIKLTSLRFHSYQREKWLQKGLANARQRKTQEYTCGWNLASPHNETEILETLQHSTSNTETLILLHFGHVWILTIEGPRDTAMPRKRPPQGSSTRWFLYRQWGQGNGDVVCYQNSSPVVSRKNTTQVCRQHFQITELILGQNHLHHVHS